VLILGRAHRWLLALLPLMSIALAVLPARAGVHATTCAPTVQQLATPPLPPRVQHALLADGEGHLYVFGGGTRTVDASGRVTDGPALRDFWRYDIADHRWQRLAAEDGPPPLLEPHLARDRAGFIYEFGGWNPELVGYSSQLYRYDPETNRWITLQPPPPRPIGRVDYGFVWEPITDQLYLFAGSTGDGYGSEQPLNDFWRYDPATNRWLDLTASSGALAIRPREIYQLSADGYGHLYLFGGATPVDGIGWEAIQDFWRFSIWTGRWEDLTQTTNTHDVPSRHYYGQAIDGAAGFYVVGGVVPGQSTPLNDAWRFDPLAWRWENVTPLFEPVVTLIPYNLAYDPGTASLYSVGGMAADGQASNSVYRITLCLPEPPDPTAIIGSHTAPTPPGGPWRALAPRVDRP
jgi:N-acetylneuraminic acid mutarotase